MRRRGPRGVLLAVFLATQACSAPDSSNGSRPPAPDAVDQGGIAAADAGRQPGRGAIDGAPIARDAASGGGDDGGGDAGAPGDAGVSDPVGQCIDGRWVSGRPGSGSPFAEPYAGLEQVCGPALARRLCELVSTGYRSISYTQARQVIFRMVDDEAGMVQGVYDGLWHAPDHSEINIEHTWPQSLGATGEAKSDMHHLFATRADFNSARSNLPLGEVVRHDWPATPVGDPTCTLPEHDQGCFSMKGRDAEDVLVFEPRDAHKGNAARAILYFSIRYGASCTIKPLRDFDARHPEVTERLLKRWNALDPPDQHERNRNDRVQEVEQVRNPFIDHPELVDRMSFQ